MGELHAVASSKDSQYYKEEIRSRKDVLLFKKCELTFFSSIRTGTWKSGHV